MARSRRTHAIVALMVLILFFLAGCSWRKERTPVTKHGVLDLSDWEPDRDGPVALAGEWEFYWDRLLTPEAFQGHAALPGMSGYLRLPGFWKDHASDSHRLPGQGQATFRLRLLPGSSAQQLGVRLFALSAAYRLWVNGQLVASAGIVGRTKKTETSERSLIMAAVPNKGGPIDLVLQISNHAFRRGGVQYPILLASMNQLEAAHIRTWCWSMFITGVLLLTFIYHIVLYLLRKKKTYQRSISDLTVSHFQYCTLPWILRIGLSDSSFQRYHQI